MRPLILQRLSCLAISGLMLLACAAPAGAAVASLSVEGERFVLIMPDGRRLTSSELVGAELQTREGRTFRIDAVAPAAERPGVLLHSFSIKDERTGAWSPVCEADAYGRRAGFPVAGRWNRRGRFVKDKQAWFLTCTLGSQGKCVLWGYDPWGRGPHGEDLARFYQACQFTVRANYDGRGAAHTRNGTSIDVSDAIGIATSGTLDDPHYAFEAGWGPQGATCVARTRWPDLLELDVLHARAPRLAAACGEAEAHTQGAILFTAIRPRLAN